MPEAPELEVVREFLAERIVGESIARAQVIKPSVLLMYDGTQTRYVLGTKGRSQQTNGEYVCKYGVTTDYNCGYIDSKDFRRQKAGQSWSSTWILVDKPGEHLVRPGDSGGPWFSGNTAYGITVAEVGDKALYMAINYIDILDVSVLTH